MANEFKIEVIEERANIYTPYNQDFVKKIKGIGGARWNSGNKCWTVPEFAVDSVRELMTEVYGRNDMEQGETVRLKITFNRSLTADRSDAVMMGKILCHASGRDSGGRVGDDVVYVKGEAFSGGSVKNWYSGVSIDSVVVLNNVSKALYEKYLENPIDYIDVELLEGKESNKKDALLKEKEQLLKRLEEIERLLKE